MEKESGMLDIVLKAFGRITEARDLFYDNGKKMRFDYNSFRETVLTLLFIIPFVCSVGIVIAVLAGEWDLGVESVKYFLACITTLLVSGFFLVSVDDFFYADLENKNFYRNRSFFKKETLKKLFSFDQVIGITVSGYYHSGSKNRSPYWEYKILLFTHNGYRLCLSSKDALFKEQNETAQLIAEKMGVPFIPGVPHKTAKLRLLKITHEKHAFFDTFKAMCNIY